MKQVSIHSFFAAVPSSKPKKKPRLDEVEEREHEHEENVLEESQIDLERNATQDNGDAKGEIDAGEESEGELPAEVELICEPAPVAEDVDHKRPSEPEGEPVDDLPTSCGETDQESDSKENDNPAEDPQRHAPDAKEHSVNQYEAEVGSQSTECSLSLAFLIGVCFCFCFVLFEPFGWLLSAPTHQRERILARNRQMLATLGINNLSGRILPSSR